MASGQSLLLHPKWIEPTKQISDRCVPYLPATKPDSFLFSAVNCLIFDRSKL